jgi:thioredoxin-related protein
MMRKILACVLFFGTALAYAGDDSAWMTDFEAAKKVAAEKNIPILADFTGSDWCGWCIRLKEEVFTKAEFISYAKDNLVLLELDFPRKKEVPEEVRKQNEALLGVYEIRGFPTILLLDAEGKELARTGYRRGGAKAYVKHLKELLVEKKAE